MALAVPALLVRVAGVTASALPALLVFGTAVVASSFLLAWAVEAAQVDVSGGSAIAVLAVVVVLPEYAVDFYFAYAAGARPEFLAYAAANMTGSNRLLLGLGWPVVLLAAAVVARRSTRGGGRSRTRRGTVVDLEPARRIDLGFLLFASGVALVIVVAGVISVPVGIVLLALFGWYLWKVSRGGVEEPELTGTAAQLGALPRRRRRAAVVGLFLFAALVVAASAEPFAQALLGTGERWGVDRFVLVQWLAPLASEAPEFIVAILFALRGRGSAAMGTLISGKVTQWTLLVGSLPLAYLAGGGDFALRLDPRQTEELLLTAAQTVLGVGTLLTCEFRGRAAALLAAFLAVQFVVPGERARLVLCGVYGVSALVAFVAGRRRVLPTLAAPFRTDVSPDAR
ncbi:sodium:proton exchanger [Amycolatopsis rhabdoformis]|uniref:Sodium:proton exchanger n=1 Tax=Amycolatopsis rhabdoformis TaxID=1448059 RepID=A0ABZ1IFB9_9PSEU|nr:sodium:proton exchanger [Amycolatopsis rhabdoformis]WSE32239.1 sodium:proton exchanger [Amycolatopsis rhabdoformis]